MAEPINLEWAREEGKKARQVMGVPREWNINMKLHDAPGGDSSNAGICYYDATYLNANIFMSRNLNCDEDGAEYIWHEVGHVLLAELAEYGLNVIADFVPEEQQARIRSGYKAQIERVLQRLVRGLGSILTETPDADPAI